MANASSQIRVAGLGFAVESVLGEGCETGELVLGGDIGFCGLLEGLILAGDEYGGDARVGLAGLGKAVHSPDLACTMDVCTMAQL